MRPERVQMTLLQRGVIQRLRDRGYALAADEARAYWNEGLSCPLGATSELDPVLDRELLSDFQRANAQASVSYET